MDHANRIRKEGYHLSPTPQVHSTTHPHHTALASALPVSSRKEGRTKPASKLITEALKPVCTLIGTAHPGARITRFCRHGHRCIYSELLYADEQVWHEHSAPRRACGARPAHTALVRERVLAETGAATSARAGESKDGSKQPTTRTTGRKKGEGAQGWVRDLGLDGALDEGPQPRNGENEESQRRVVARLRVTCPAVGHRGRGVEEDRGAVQRRARRGGTDSSSPRNGSTPGVRRGRRCAPRCWRLGAEREEEAPRSHGGGGVHFGLGIRAAGMGKRGSLYVHNWRGPCVSGSGAFVLSPHARV